ncbi:hypothetical protein ACQP1U_00320 [Actinomycetota bacterium]
MGTVELHRAKGGRYESAELGWFKQRKWYSADVDAQAPGGEPMVFRRSAWQTHFHADDAQGRPIGDHPRTDWLHGRGPLTWQSVAYDFVRSSAWKGSYALTRYDEQLALFTPSAFGRTMTIEVADTVTPSTVPPGLLLFCAWITHQTQEDTSSAAGGGAGG